ncbi:MAG: GNAT family N-acetyltransferase [Paenibacillaceae bacterium]|nr:GNAT family N-acetyltransferase [Paenibacillaceae bacterium]
MGGKKAVGAGVAFVPLAPIHAAAVTALWNGEWRETFPMRERIVAQNCFEDANVVADGSWLAVDETSGEAVGFVVAKRWQDGTPGVSFDGRDGWIHALLVRGDRRGAGIGGELLRRGEEALRACGVSRIHLGGDFHWRMFPGVPEQCAAAAAWFERRGYSGGEPRVDLARDYGAAAEATPLPQPAAGARFRIAQPADRERLAAFLQRCFPGRWAYQTIQYWDRGGNGREFVLCEEGGELVGFCRINDGESPIYAQNVYWAPLFAGELGGIGPLGIDDACRGKGYGLAIVQAAIHFLRGRGADSIVIDTTGIPDFYRKLGYEVYRSYTPYSKELAG